MEALMSPPLTFGSRLRQFREDAGLTQEDLAELVGITDVSLYRYETDDRLPKWDVVLKLADALGVTPNDFRPPEEPPARAMGKRK